MILSLIFLSLAVVCYSISQLQQHGKLRWMPSSIMSFGHASVWGSESWRRKYKYDNGTPIDAPKNWYYKLFKIKYKEAFPLSATFLIAFTDGYHFCQFMFFNFLSLSITFALDFQWLTLGLVWGLIHGIHFLVYRLLSK